MLVREYKESDLDALRAMHARQGFGYPFPDLADPIFVSKLVLEDESGLPVMASLARLTCEMYLLMDRENSQERSLGGDRGANDGAGRAAPLGYGGAGNPRQRYGWLLALHAAGERDLLVRGLDDAHAWLPPAVAKRFGRRLEALGWVRDDTWSPYCRRLNDGR
ncbi:MAG: hypothetical protein ACRD4X_18575 [Candidatus Acidiferrales bacterium]